MTTGSVLFESEDLRLLRVGFEADACWHGLDSVGLALSIDVEAVVSAPFVDFCESVSSHLKVKFLN